MSKLPSLQFYPGDWRKDPGVQALNYQDRGIWFEILLLMHESEPRGKLLLNGKPMPEDALARLLGLDKQILTTTLSTLREYGVSDVDPITGALMNRRMVRDEEIRKKRIECGKLGGNPILVNQKSTTRVKRKPTPSSSSSFSKEVPPISPKGGGAFDRFYAAFPKKKAPKAARRAWEKLSPGPELVERIIQAVEAQKMLPDWRKDAGKFVPHPATWLNGERWLDELTPVMAGQNGIGGNLDDFPSE